ncbi:MAG: hypothetical protein AAGE84_09825 [Cyanobacteria bacterium P01_G01_bin.39]
MLWFRKLYAAIMRMLGGGQPAVNPKKPTVNQEQSAVNLDQSEMESYFLDLSVALTNFSKFDLLGTGQSDLYYLTIEQEIGQETFQELLQTFHDLELQAQDDQSVLEQKLRAEILDSDKLGNIARNIIKLWYSATWHSLTSKDKRVVSPQAYPEGLLWRSIGVNPPGAKAPGYDSWSEEPEVTLS